MPSLTCFTVRFTPSWFMIILTLVFVLLFTRLGFWQIQRAQQKEEMLAAQASLAQQKTIMWREGQPLPAQYQHLILQGDYLSTVFLLDNQHQQHQFGYNVLSPLLLGDGSVVMIDRGWMRGDSTRRSFPHVDTPKHRLTVHGSAYFPSSKQWVLGPSWEEKGKNLTIIELLDAKMLSQLLQKKVYPFIIRLDKEDGHGFVREWAIVSMPPQRHLAYALQWFAMALVIAIIFIALNLKKKK